MGTRIHVMCQEKRFAVLGTARQPESSLKVKEVVATRFVLSPARPAALPCTVALCAFGYLAERAGLVRVPVGSREVVSCPRFAL